MSDAVTKADLAALAAHIAEATVQMVKAREAEVRSEMEARNAEALARMEAQNAERFAEMAARTETILLRVESRLTLAERRVASLEKSGMTLD